MDFVIPFVDQGEALPDEVAEAFLKECEGKRKFAFIGEMGAGKTTFIKALCRHLGVQENISSPTYSIINEYSNGEPIFHLDLYRLENAQEAIEAGVLDCLDGPFYCFIEWPERIAEYLHQAVVRVKLTTDEKQGRILEIL